MMIESTRNYIDTARRQLDALERVMQQTCTHTYHWDDFDEWGWRWVRCEHCGHQEKYGTDEELEAAQPEVYKEYYKEWL